MYTFFYLRTLKGNTVSNGLRGISWFRGEDVVATQDELFASTSSIKSEWMHDLEQYMTKTMSLLDVKLDGLNALVTPDIEALQKFETPDPQRIWSIKSIGIWLICLFSVYVGLKVIPSHLH
eukprot:4433482-Amphidinium_carterae.1